MTTIKDSMDEFYAEIAKLPDTLEKTALAQPVTVVPTNTSLTVGKQNPPVYAPPTTPNEPTDAESLKVYTIQQSKSLIANLLETLEALQSMAVSTADGKLVTGYATIGGSAVAALANLNSLALAEQKEKAAVELETQKHQQRIAMLSAKKPNQTNTVNIIAGREEIMKLLAEDQAHVRPEDNSGDDDDN